MAGPCEPVEERAKWTGQGSRHGSPRFTKHIRVLGLIGGAVGGLTCVYAIVNADSFGDQLDAIVAQLHVADQQITPLEALVDRMAVTESVCQYLGNFTPDGTAVAIVRAGSIYRLIQDFEW